MNSAKPEVIAAQGHKKPGVPIGLIAGAIALVIVLLLPLPASLPVAGQRMLAILAFAVVVWLTEAVSYEASAIIITSLMVFLVGTAPTIDDPSQFYGTSKAISMALAGFSNSTLALVTLSLIGTATRRILIGAIAVISAFGVDKRSNIAPQNMVCLATETFTARQFARVGIVLTVLGYLLLLLFAATWWRWLGWI
jgi:solute carrier family 13 (sodium-dependent dicarboxylate transporter), member 2/3/5